MASLFERLDKGRPAPVEAATEQLRGGSPPIEKLLDWLVNYWTKPTVTAREIYTYGPNPVRDKKTTLSLAQVLVEPGVADTDAPRLPHWPPPPRQVGMENWGARASLKSRAADRPLTAATAATAARVRAQVVPTFDLPTRRRAPALAGYPTEYSTEEPRQRLGAARP